MKRDQRYGRFFVSNHLLSNDAGNALLIFAGLMVLETRYRPDMDAIEYMAWAPFFSLNPPGTEAPFYEVTVKKDRTVVWGDGCNGEVIAHVNPHTGDYSPASAEGSDQPQPQSSVDHMAAVRESVAR